MEGARGCMRMAKATGKIHCSIRQLVQHLFCNPQNNSFRILMLSFHVIVFVHDIRINQKKVTFLEMINHRSYDNGTQTHLSVPQSFRTLRNFHPKGIVFRLLPEVVLTVPVSLLSLPLFNISSLFSHYIAIFAVFEAIFRILLQF